MPSNAGSQPDAMMIEVHHTVIANIAVCCSLRSENHACLAVLESIELRNMARGVVLREIHKVHSLRFRDYVTIALVDGSWLLSIEMLKYKILV
jgi:hypothetical protein